MATTTALRCIETNKAGSACSGYRIANSNYCFLHDPAMAAKRAEARSRGGKARQGRQISRADAGPPMALATVASVDGVRLLLSRAVADAMTCEPSLSRARTFGFLAQVALKALE